MTEGNKKPGVQLLNEIQVIHLPRGLTNRKSIEASYAFTLQYVGGATSFRTIHLVAPFVILGKVWMSLATGGISALGNAGRVCSRPLKLDRAKSIVRYQAGVMFRNLVQSTLTLLDLCNS